MSSESSWQKERILSYKYHCRSVERPFGRTTSGSCVESGIQLFFVTVRAISGVSACSLTKNYVGLATTESKMMIFLVSNNSLEVWSQVCGPVVCLHQIITILTLNNLGSITNSRFLSDSGNVSNSAHRGSTKQTFE